MGRLHGPCLAIAAADLPAGTVVTLVDPRVQETLTARIAGPHDGPCLVGPVEGLPLEQYGDSVYGIDIVDGEPDDHDVYIAALFPPHRHAVRQGHVRCDLDGEEPEESFRVCTSTEGLHLTV